MRYIKMLGLAAVAVIAMMAVAATASATTLTSPTGTTYTTTVEAEDEGGGVTLHGTGQITCASGGWGTIEQHGSSSIVSGTVNEWEFSNCPNSMHATVLKPGKLEVLTGESANIGTVTSTGAEVQVTDTNVGITCIYTTNTTDIGRLTDSHKTSSTATLEIQTQSVPRTGGSIFCGTSGSLTGNYVITTPDALYID